MFLWSDTKLVVEGMVPNLFHVIPVGYDTVLDGVLECQYTALGLGFVALPEFSWRDYQTGIDTYPT